MRSTLVLAALLGLATLVGACRHEHHHEPMKLGGSVSSADVAR